MKISQLSRILFSSVFATALLFLVPAPFYLDVIAIVAIVILTEVIFASLVDRFIHRFRAEMGRSGFRYHGIIEVKSVPYQRVNILEDNSFRISFDHWKHSGCHKVLPRVYRFGQSIIYRKVDDDWTSMYICYDSNTETFFVLQNV